MYPNQTNNQSKAKQQYQIFDLLIYRTFLVTAYYWHYQTVKEYVQKMKFIIEKWTSFLINHVGKCQKLKKNLKLVQEEVNFNLTL